MDPQGPRDSFSARAGRSPQTLLIVPAYNEEAVLPGVLREIRDTGLDLEIAVVDDGSHDGTSAVAEAAGATVLRHPLNLGYGAALQTGYKYALNRHVSLLVQMDADGQHDPADISAMVEQLKDGRYDLVVGSRFVARTGYRMGILRTIGRQLFRAIARPLGVTISDPTSGFQAMNRRVLEEYARDFFPADYPDVDVLIVAARRGLRIGEHSVRMRAGVRDSVLHGGLRDVYYVYKMLLSIWSISGREHGAPGPPLESFDPTPLAGKEAKTR